MSEQEQNLKNTPKNTNNSEISDKERKKIVIIIKIFLIVITILTGFIIEALINQHPVFDFLPYTFFKQELVILGSVALAASFLGYLILLISIGNLILTNFEFNINIYLISLIGIIFIIASFIMSIKSYNWRLGSLNFFFYPLNLVIIATTLIMAVKKNIK